MSLKTLGAAGLGLLATFAVAHSAAAQAAPAAAKTAPAAPAAATLATGPAIPGVCVYSGDRAILSSTVGKFVLTRIQTIEAQANAELTAEKNAIVAEGKRPLRHRKRDLQVRRRIARRPRCIIVITNDRSARRLDRTATRVEAEREKAKANH